MATWASTKPTKWAPRVMEVFFVMSGGYQIVVSLATDVRRVATGDRVEYFG